MVVSHQWSSWMCLRIKLPFAIKPKPKGNHSQEIRLRMVSILRWLVPPLLGYVSQVIRRLWSGSSSTKTYSNETDAWQCDGQNVWSKTKYSSVFYSDRYHPVWLCKYRLNSDINETHSKVFTSSSSSICSWQEKQPGFIDWEDYKGTRNFRINRSNSW